MTRHPRYAFLGANRQVALPALTLLPAIVVMSLGVLIPVSALRAIVVLPLALLTPGFALITAAGGDKHQLEVAPALALSALLSMAIYPLLAIAMWAAGIPLSTGSVLGGTDAIVLVLAAIIVLRGRAGTGIRVDAGVNVPAHPWSGRGILGVLLFAAFVAVIVAVLTLMMHLLPAATSPPYTQVYLTGPWSHVSSVEQVQPHRPLSVTFGITNRTHRPQAYRIASGVDDAFTWHDRLVTIPPGQTWGGSTGGSVPQGGCIHRLSITVSAVPSGSFVGSLVLWIRTTAGTPARCTATQRTASAP